MTVEKPSLVVPRIAMVLAAGYGTRMGELTRNLPKPLLRLTDELTILDVVLSRLESAGVERIVVNVHYLAGQLKQHLANRASRAEICISEEPRILGSGGGIAAAERFFEGETILAVNADVLCEVGIADFCNRHHQHKALATMAVLPSRNSADYTLVVYDDREFLQDFLPRHQAVPAGQGTGIFTGYQLLTPQARKSLRPIPQSIISEFYRPAIDSERGVGVFPITGQWIDIGTEARYLEIREQIKSGELDLAIFR